MLIRKILIIGACNAQLVFSQFTPEEISVIGREEELNWLKEAPEDDLTNKLLEVKAAIIIYKASGVAIFKRFVKRGIPCILILSKKKPIKGSFSSLLRELLDQGAKGIFLDGFQDNPHAMRELYRQVNNFIA